ncbi:hypothetical protein [Ruegeria halocynthiae]|uniref:hypothetical protein n=1 Tax=Ruegeria halocynthiae TaxID=985054 RepID=UPI00068D6FC2|nr:hypothetical protein [Ruegeria halocynthiae]
MSTPLSIDPEELLPRAAKPIIKVRDIAHVRFTRPDLNKASAYFSDFGLRQPQHKGDTLYMFAEAGLGPAMMFTQSDKANFCGVGLLASSAADLDKLVKEAGAVGPEPAEGWPEGKQVRLRDPAGNEVRVLYGPSPDVPAVRRAMTMNLMDERNRVNELQRPPLRPSTILRLGHCVLSVLEFNQVARWYMDTLGLVPSDIQILDRFEPALVFLRCDRGDEPADHHTIVVAQNVENKFSHAAFEVIDMDDIAMGQEHMFSRGWKHAWGMGRHLLGSQLFDYWRDPWDDKFEHFCDSDLFTGDRPADVSLLTMGGLYQWGPPVPHDFEAPKISPGFILRTLRNIRNSHEMTFKKMFRLLKVAKQKPRSWKA